MKMSIEVALCLIKNHNERLKRTLKERFNLTSFNELCISEALNMASDALKKQIPKKPIVGNDCGCSTMSCPTCDGCLYRSEWDRNTQQKYHQKYCLHCGQRLTTPTNILGEWEEF